jgi:hypothetical protein
MDPVTPARMSDGCKIASRPQVLRGQIDKENKDKLFTDQQLKS